MKRMGGCLRHRGDINLKRISDFNMNKYSVTDKHRVMKRKSEKKYFCVIELKTHVGIIQS